MKKALIICGATATGKTSLAIDCAVKLNTEIISADSQLVYKGLNIGTAKPTVAERRGIKHHLIDVVSAKDNFSVSDYERLASPLVAGMMNEGRIPIICGGTGFYINSLLFELGYGGVMANQAIRKKYEDLLNIEGAQALHDRLRHVDPETADKLHKNDTKRVIRALEIFEVSGKKKSEQKDQLIPRFPYLAVAIDFPRGDLYERINNRVDIMFNSGLIDEVRNLLSSGVDESCMSMQAIGYKEVLQGIKNRDNESTMREIIKKNTRHYAKRQYTFFKKLPNIVWLSPKEATVENVMELLYD